AWRARARPHWPVAALTAIALAWYLFRAVATHQRFLTTGYDLGIFDQAIRAYAHFQTPIVPLKGPGYNILGDHFHPIIAILAPLYWIWDTPLTLVVAQAILMAATIPIVHRFARRRASQTLSLTITAAYAIGWPIQALIDFDFHEIAFAQPLLAIAIDALDRRRPRTLVIASALLLTVREDMGVLVVLLAALWWLQRRHDRRPPAAARAPAILALAGIAGYLLATAVVIPHFANGDGYAYAGQYGALGDSLTQAALHTLTHPATTLHLLATPATKLATLTYLLAPTALLALRSRYAILAAPLLIERFLNSRATVWGQSFHYNALPWLILILAMTDAADRLGLCTARSGWARRSRRALGGWLAAFPILLMILGTNPPSPLDRFRDGAMFWDGARVRAAQAAVAVLPPDSCVDADSTLVPHLTPHNYVTVPHTGAQDADFVALDTTARTVGGNDGPPPDEVLAAVEASGYQRVFHAGSLIVLRSPDYAGPSTACGPLGAGPDATRARGPG
ncbi:MAG: DUF2079 domain-containing protein, partial [Actinomycetia bacterium]|nr:DUF2079 domain-containing protein [Actinomycetes bacterium]